MAERVCVLAIVAGIDEAGYGPMLGPLVVSQAAFDVPDELAEQCLWAQLADSITAKVSKRDPRLPIVDSKKLHHSGAGLAAIEQTALVMLAASGCRPATFLELLQALCPAVENNLPSYPWYRHLQDAVPLECDAMTITLKANAVRRNLRREKIQFLGVRSCILPEGHFNRLVVSTRNKATVLWTLTLKLISYLMRLAGGRNLYIFIDRQGARIRYAQTLLTAFEDANLQVIEESAELSRYQLRFDRDVEGRPQGAAGFSPRDASCSGKTSLAEKSRRLKPAAPWCVTIEFRQSGESAHLPTALASIYSKYLRELFMVAFNRYWQQRVGGLKRTAGYYRDGLRFVRDIEPVIQSLDIDRHMLIRSR